jgi:hypothetical protein
VVFPVTYFMHNSLRSFEGSWRHLGKSDVVGQKWGPKIKIFNEHLYLIQNYGHLKYSK